MIDHDGRFRIEDVVPGTYKMEVYFHDLSHPGGVPRPIGPYRAAIEVPTMSQAYTYEPLDVGKLVLRLPDLRPRDAASSFETMTDNSQETRLAGG